MSFIRYIYNTFFKKLVDKSFTLSDALHVLELLKDLKNGTYVDKYEIKELEGSQKLAAAIDARAELLPLLLEVLNSKRGPEIREAVMQHRVLVHALWYNKKHVLNELSAIIDQLEFEVRKKETASNPSIKVISAPQIGPGVLRK